ncbi:MAG: hypothetical protein RLZZ487_1713, partial [Pseudomonadota bacterium]
VHIQKLYHYGREHYQRQFRFLCRLIYFFVSLIELEKD